MGHTLNKPYSEEEYADFVCEHQELIPIETDSAFYMLEAHEKLQNGEIVDVSETDEYKAKVSEAKNAAKKVELQAQIDELDIKRIRAIAEPELKDAEEGQTWLEYYTAKIIELRAQINALN